MTTLKRGSLHISFIVMSALILAAAARSHVHAITINMEYTDAGSTPPHPENPDWDPDGSILIAHFQAAKAIWEALLPGGGSYSFDFHWDNDIPGLGLYTDSGVDEFIEINPDYDWFADPDPLDDFEFAPGAQKLYSGLMPSEQSTFFPGSAPPGALEVSFRGAGLPNGTFVNGAPVNTLSASEQVLPGTATPVDASNGFDLLSVILHEIGHALGISGIEPGEYNIFPQHVGGLNNVLVLEHPDSGHLAGDDVTPGFLMNPGTPRGQRVFATATDVLVIAEDQGIDDVRLARVGRISGGLWSESDRWIGGDVPGSSSASFPDVYITHGGNVTLDVDVHIPNLLVAPGNSFDTQFGRGINVQGTITFTGAALSVASTATIAANTLFGDPGSITTTSGSHVRFNQFTGNTSSSANFNGSLAIGHFTGIGAPPVHFDPATLPTPISNWTIAESLTIGDASDASLLVRNSTWNVGGNVIVGGNLGALRMQTSGSMTVGGNLEVGTNGAVHVEAGAALDVAGDYIVNKTGRLTYWNDRTADNETYDVRGGETTLFCPPTGCVLVRTSGGILTFQDTTTAADATVNLEGGAGDDAPPGLVIFSGNASASTAEFRTKGGRRGPTLGGFEIDGFGGEVRFENTSGARNAIFINQGISDHYGGTGGRTVFANNSSAEQATIHNHGATTPATLLSPIMGGATLFRDFSTAASANITNHADGVGGSYWLSAHTIFYDSSDAGNATIENRGGATQTAAPGRTEFRGNSSAALSNIHNRAHPTPGGAGGSTTFYDNATAADATIHTYEGYSDVGSIAFYGNSHAGRARLIVENVPEIVGSSGNGGRISFYDNSSLPPPSPRFF